MADNAVPITVEDAGPFRLLFFSHDSPVRAGVVELSVMLLDRESGHPRSDWSLTGGIRADSLRSGPGSAWVSPCCRIGVSGESQDRIPLNFQRSRGGNLFARETTTLLPVSGRWKLDVRLEVPGRPPLNSEIVLDVLRPRAPLEVYWAWFAAIPVAVGVYIWSKQA